MAHSYAPIALFVYNRLEHTTLVLEALKCNHGASETDLFIFSDGPKSPEAKDKVETLRQYLKTVSGFKTITITERPLNLGLAQSIITGVTEVVERFGRIIVVEDDLITSPFFLQYMNEALDYYQDESKVISIHGHLPPLLKKVPENFFLRGADCWGWATWKRGWKLFERDGNKLLDELIKRKLQKQFDFGNSYPYTQMLRHQVTGQNNSWAIRWHCSAFLNEKLTLYPGRSLVTNIGFDGSGTHCGDGKEYVALITDRPVPILPIPVIEHKKAVRAFRHYFRSKVYPKSFWSETVWFFRRPLGKIYRALKRVLYAKATE